ncbi:MAG: hypothetical protein EOM23_05970, partial [Candidatus Moranbacteria bacterium]|nr:hypothetical protein [Candidatus Moranbacteria bacterium]
MINEIEKINYFLDLDFKCKHIVTNILGKTDEDKIRSCKSNKKGNTVSLFNEWIYDATVYRPHEVDEKESQTAGKKVEEVLTKGMQKKNNYFKIKESHSYSMIKKWERIYEDLSENNNEAFTISKLQFNGKPFKGKPDIVYKSIQGNIMIIEVKCTDKAIDPPIGGWYNLQCQLWAYSWIDMFENANNIYLLADIKLRENVIVNGKSGWKFTQSK